MGSRHVIKYDYSLKNVLNPGTIYSKEVDLDATKWSPKTIEGLSHFVQENIPNWESIIIVRNKIVVDPKKVKEKDNQPKNQIVGNTESRLVLIRDDSYTSGYLKVDKNLQKNGKFPKNLIEFIRTR